MFSARNLKILIATFLVIFSFFIGQQTVLVRADDCTNPNIDSLPAITGCIGQFSQTLDSISKANTTNKTALKALQGRVNALKEQIDGLLAQVEKKQTEINARNQDFDQEYAKLSLMVKSYYIRSYYPSGLMIMLGSKNAADALRLLGIYSVLSKRDKDTIADLATQLSQLQTEKKQLQTQAEAISSLKKDVDSKVQFLAGEVAKADAYEAQLQSQIAQLTARQQEILAQRLASLNIPRSAASMGRCDSDLTNGRDPGFSPKFGAFTYGVPNRVGLNQWGAYGRAQAGQGYDEILRAYYNFDGYKDVDTNTQIRVDGYGTYSLEDYVKRIYEVPGDWPAEALKAQAVAARSYAMAYTNNGAGSICATQQCQVFQPNEKGGAWNDAVNATAGKVMQQGGNPIKAWFSSTHGGYVFSSGDVGWSATSWTKEARDTSGNVGSFSDLQSTSYDKTSPWFYCDWGSRSNYNNTAWLKPDELADIVNVLMLYQKDSGTAEHLYQPDKSNPAGTDTWNSDRVKQELRSRGGSPFNNISSVSISADFGSGRVTTVSVSGDAPTQSFSGADFKDFFDLRAPANIQIVGPLYNIEKR
ncbi:MAG: SpoIID/LytB domain-containing protein [Patescibacteria group bacterium]|nr:SpoIID/LytB domain-containing protein [Patescibacteria group bacterium]